MNVLLFGPGQALYRFANGYEAVAASSFAMTASASAPRRSRISSGAAPYHSASAARMFDTETAERPARAYQPITS